MAERTLRRRWLEDAIAKGWNLRQARYLLRAASSHRPDSRGPYQWLASYLPVYMRVPSG